MAAAVTATTGTLTRKAEPHQKRWSRAPETTGPIAAPAPAKPTHTAMARRRSSGGKMAVISESVAGITKAAPAPCTARPTMTTVADPANPLITDPVANTARPTSSAPLRPKRSPSAPAVRSRPAKTSAYASTIHWSIVALASSSRCSVGSATFNPETAMTTMTSDRQSTARSVQRRSWTSGWA